MASSSSIVLRAVLPPIGIINTSASIYFFHSCSCSSVSPRFKIRFPFTLISNPIEPHPILSSGRGFTIVVNGPILRTSSPCVALTPVTAIPSISIVSSIDRVRIFLNSVVNATPLARGPNAKIFPFISRSIVLLQITGAFEAFATLSACQ